MLHDVYNILKELKCKKHRLFLFGDRKYAKNYTNILRKFEIEQFFNKRIFLDGTRIQHLSKVYHDCNRIFEDIIYFESNQISITSGRGMSVFTFCTEYGINYTLVNQALRFYQDHRKSMFVPYTDYPNKRPTRVRLERYLKGIYGSDEIIVPGPTSAPSKSSESAEDIFELNDKTYIDK